jgi:ferric-dicitrate binding protein FerR (iron transport regulator)
VSGNKKLRLENLLLDDSFVRYVKEIANEEERIDWQKWERHSTDNEDLVRRAKELIEFTESNGIRIPDPHTELRKLEGSIKGTSIHPKKNEDRNRFKANSRMRSSWLAAALVLVFISIGVFQFVEMKEQEAPTVAVTTSSTSEYHTGFGEKAFLHLTDGSRIVLNAQSHLSYTWSGSGVNGQQIDIYLNGEAWFDIEPSTDQKPRLLRVHTQDGIVEVTGTVFTVQTTSNGTLAVLKKGEIQISPQASLNNTAGINKTILTPGEMAQFFSDTDEIRIENVNPEVYTSWVRDVWTFEQTPLNKIAKRIETVFGVEVRINPTDLNERTLSGTISSTNLKLITEGLSEALQVQVRHIDNKILIGPES